MSDLVPGALSVAVAVILSGVLCRIVMVLGVRDAPTEARKFQKAPVPTSGGLGFAAATACGVLAAIVVRGEAMSTGALWISIGAIAALILGAVDDVRAVPARWKLIAMVAIAMAMTAKGVRVETLAPWPEVSWSLPLALGAAGSIAWLVVVMNAVNFMDGANGLAMGMAAIASAGMAVCCAIVGVWDVALVCAALAGSLAGFLVWNIPGRLFAGDAGALFVGTVLAGAGLMLVAQRPDLVMIPPLLMAPFLTDVLLTLAWRGYRGRKLFDAHLDHAYQIALKARLSHMQVSGIHAVWAANAAAVAIVATISGGYAPTLAASAMILVGAWVHIRVRASGVRAGLVGDDAT